MSWLKGKDISQYQGNWVDTGEDFVIIKMGGGDAGNYYDSKATQNYSGAVNAGKVVGGYWFAGGTNAIAEADFFVRAMSPLSENDIFALDWEVQHANPVQWCLDFVNEVHTKTGVWCLLYVNLSTLQAHDWTPVLNNCGLWLADWSVSPDDNAPTNYTYVMQQYTDVPYDKDAFFGTREELQAYGYHAPQTSTPISSQVPTPDPVETPTPSTSPSTPPVATTEPPVEVPPPDTVITPTPPVTTGTNIDGVIPVTVNTPTPPLSPKPTLTPTPVPDITTTVPAWIIRLIKFLKGLIGIIEEY